MADTNKNPGKGSNTTDMPDSKTDSTKTVAKAHEQAEQDIENDPDLQPDPTADLDEGELARLEGED